MLSHKELHKKSRSTHSVSTCISPCTSRSTLPHFGEEEEEEEIYQPVTSISQAPSISSGNNSSLLYANVEPVYQSLA